MIPSAPLGTDAAGRPAGLGSVPGAGRDRAAARRFRFELAAHPASPAQARRLVRARLTGWSVGEDTCDSAVLVVSELVTNAIVHTESGTVVCELYDGPDVVRIAVRDEGCTTGEPRPAAQRAEEEQGRGLLLIDAICTAWGAQEHGAGLLVWADLPRGDAPQGGTAEGELAHTTPTHTTPTHAAPAYADPIRPGTLHVASPRTNSPHGDLGWGARSKPAPERQGEGAEESETKQTATQRTTAQQQPAAQRRTALPQQPVPQQRTPLPAPQHPTPPQPTALQRTAPPQRTSPQLPSPRRTPDAHDSLARQLPLPQQGFTAQPHPASEPPVAMRQTSVRQPAPRRADGHPQSHVQSHVQGHAQSHPQSQAQDRPPNFSPNQPRPAHPGHSPEARIPAQPTRADAASATRPLTALPALPALPLSPGHPARSAPHQRAQSPAADLTPWRSHPAPAHAAPRPPEPASVQHSVKRPSERPAEQERGRE